MNTGLPLKQRLCNFLMTYRSSTHSTTGVSPSSLFLHTRFDLFRPNRESHVRDKQEQQKVDHDRHARVRRFAVSDPVMVKNFRTGPDWLPATIVACLGPLSYLVQTTDGEDMLIMLNQELFVLKLEADLILIKVVPGILMRLGHPNLLMKLRNRIRQQRLLESSREVSLRVMLLIQP